MNITDAIWRTSYAWPERVAVIHEGQPISYASLRGLANLVSTRLAATGVRPGDCVAIDLKNRLAHLVTVLAIARMGAVASTLHTTDGSVRESLLARHSASWMIQDESNAWRSAVLVPHAHLSDQALFAPPVAGQTPDRPPYASELDDETWLIVLTSGTTGIPKSIAHSHRRGLISFVMGRPVLPGNPPVVLVFIGLATMMGISNVMRTLIAGATVVLTGSQEPAVFFDTVARERPGRVVTSTGMAGVLAAYAAASLPDSLAICASVQTIAVAGSAVSPALRDAIGQRICPNLEINYGSTEGGFLAQATPEIGRARPLSSGQLQPWVQGEAVDQDDQPLPAGQVGTLRFKTPLAATGYLHDAEATARSFRQGWYYPGDLGSIDAAGFMVLAGRADHLINRGGNKLDPVSVEQVLDSHPAVLESGVVAKDHTVPGMPLLVAVVVLREQMQATKAELKQWCSQRLGKMKSPDRVVFARTLPRNAGGKLMRTELAAGIHFQSTSQEG